MIRSVRPPDDRVERRGIRAWALAVAVCVCAVVAVPAGAATVDHPPGPGAPARPGPGAPAPPMTDPPGTDPDGPPVTPVPAVAAPAPAAPQPDDAPRPVAARPTAGGGDPASGASLAIRRLTVAASVELTAERPARLTMAFVPRPGSLVAQVRVSARHGSARRLIASKLVQVRGGRRATVRLRVAGMAAGTYDVSVRAGAGPATLGPAIVARLEIV